VALFDRYLIVDWSAANAPTTGKDSIWLALYDGADLASLENIATRGEAMARIREVIRDSLSAGKRMLTGFDFAFGYPSGMAQRIGGEADWTVLWRRLAALLADDAANVSNSYDVAAELNRNVFPEMAEGPFWGQPHQHQGRYPGLSATKNRDAFLSVPEFRHVEGIAKGAKSIWQLAYNGAVGRQAMLGMAHLERLRREPDIADHVSVWPFETKFADSLEKPVVISEVYPSLFPVDRTAHRVLDAAQVMAVGAAFAKLDAAHRLKPLLAAPAAMTPNTRETVEREEGWIVGAGHDLASRPAVPIPDSLDYVRTPEAIYAKSFEMISRVEQLQALPEAIRPVATRIVHACGMPEILDDLRYSSDIVDAVRTALEGGADIYCDVETLRHGVMAHLLPKGCKLHCRISAPEVATHAKQNKMTRAAAQVDLWGERLEGQVVAIGNAPTTLFRLLEQIDAGGAKPAAIVAFPVGFVGAAESKAELAANPRGIPFITLTGQKGGTAMAQAAVNALAGGLNT
jgi:precorrin isomerase